MNPVIQLQWQDMKKKKFKCKSSGTLPLINSGFHSGLSTQVM